MTSERDMREIDRIVDWVIDDPKKARELKRILHDDLLHDDLQNSKEKPVTQNADDKTGQAADNDDIWDNLPV